MSYSNEFVHGHASEIVHKLQHGQGKLIRTRKWCSSGTELGLEF